MAYELKTLEGFDSDLFAAIDWYVEINPKLAEQFIREIDSAFAIIATHPLSFPKAYKKTRKINLIRFPYKVIFEMRKQEIIIIALAHHKRKPKYWKGRK